MKRREDMVELREQMTACCGRDPMKWQAAVIEALGGLRQVMFGKIDNRAFDACAVLQSAIAGTIDYERVRTALYDGELEAAADEAHEIGLALALQGTCVEDMPAEIERAQAIREKRARDQEELRRSMREARETREAKQ